MHHIKPWWTLCNTSFSKIMVSVGSRRLLPDGVMLAVFICMAFCFGRAALPMEDPPAFLMEQVGGGWVELGHGFKNTGFRQYADELGPDGIIKLTEEYHISPEVLANPDWTRPLENGERLDIGVEDGKIAGFNRSWTTAWSRMTLAVPLEPDRMTLEDWPALPGIGAKLAARIEFDRQKNGDFGSLGAVQRVSGIGPKRIASWKEYFFRQ